MLGKRASENEDLSWITDENLSRNSRDDAGSAAGVFDYVGGVSVGGVSPRLVTFSVNLEGGISVETRLCGLCVLWGEPFMNNTDRLNHRERRKRKGEMGCGSLREGDAEGAALAGLAFDLDIAVVVFDDGFDDGEAEAGVAAACAAGGIDSVEAVEEAGEMLGGNALALVGDFEHGLRRLFAGTGGEFHAHLAAGFLVLDGV